MKNRIVYRCINDFFTFLLLSTCLFLSHAVFAEEKFEEREKWKASIYRLPEPKRLTFGPEDSYQSFRRENGKEINRALTIK